MLGTALYYPHIDIKDGAWLRSAILFWDELQTIVPTTIEKPYIEKDTQICEKEGYLHPLRCDLYQDILEQLEKRVFSLLDSYGDNWSSSYGGMEYDSLIQDVNSMAKLSCGKLSRNLQRLLIKAVSLEMFDPEKDASFFVETRSDELEAEIQKLRRVCHSYPDAAKGGVDGNWITVDRKFIEVYMAALAALLATKVQVSPLTNEKAYSIVNLQCLIDDVASRGPTATRGALVSVIMEGIRVDPETPIQKLLAFRRSHRDQLAELSGVFDELKSKIENSSSPQELEEAARRITENKVRPGLQRLKDELHQHAIQGVWEGVHKAMTVSAAGGVPAVVPGFSGSMLLAAGAGAFISLMDVGIKSYLARHKARAASPYTYLLDIESKFSLPS